MRFQTDALGLTLNSFALLRDLIHQHLGLYYENSKRDLLADKLSKCVIEGGFDSFLDYYYYLKYDAAADREWLRVMDALSVQETYFWREPDQIRVLVDVLVPQYVAERRPQPLRIWSAACATGEEPLSIAMALEEAGWFDRIPIELYGSDASPAAIAAAQRGIYRERSFRKLSATLKSKYFVRHDQHWQIQPHLHGRVRWAVANLLVEEDVRRLATAPFIFCRNAFIYFSDEAVTRAARTFYRHMPAPGYLFLSTAESLLRLNTGFVLEDIDGAFVYVKT